jgi:hypothetical protein
MECAMTNQDLENDFDQEEIQAEELVDITGYTIDDDENDDVTSDDVE